MKTTIALLLAVVLTGCVTRPTTPPKSVVQDGPPIPPGMVIVKKNRTVGADITVTNSVPDTNEVPVGDIIFRWSATNKPPFNVVSVKTVSNVTTYTLFALAYTNNCTITVPTTVTNGYRITDANSNEVAFQSWPPVRLNSSVTLAWTPNTETNLVGYRIYTSTNSAIPKTDMVSVAPLTNRWNIYFTNQGGVTYYSAITATNSAGLESIPSLPVSYRVLNGIIADPAVDTPLNGIPYSMTYTWPRVTGCTNILQTSTNLLAWSNVKVVTSGTASVTVTNPLMTSFYRVALVNPTNTPAIVLTQAVAQVTLSWQGSTNQVVERLIDGSAGSYTPVYTNATGTNALSIRQPAGYYRLAPWK